MTWCKNNLPSFHSHLKSLPLQYFKNHFYYVKLKKLSGICHIVKANDSRKMHHINLSEIGHETTVNISKQTFQIGAIRFIPISLH
jgi:hypothetical protein